MISYSHNKSDWKRSVKGGAKTAFNYFEKNPAKTAKLSFWLILLIIIFIFGKGIIEWVNSWFSSGPSDEEQKKQDAIDKIYIDESAVTLTDQQIADRITKFKNSLTGTNDPKLCFEALTKIKPRGIRFKDISKAKKIHDELKQAYEDLKNPLYSIQATAKIADLTAQFNALQCTLLEEYVALPTHERLGYYNIRKIYKTFGIQPWGTFSTVYGSMSDWVSEDESGSEFAFFWHIMEKCDLK